MVVAREMNEWDNLPELTDEERRALDGVDMTPILGTMEHRWRLAMDVAVRFMRERNEAREAARALYQGLDTHRRMTAKESWPWLEEEK